MCPADIAYNQAKQNRHQFDIIVSGIEEYIPKITELGGELIHDIVVEGNCKSLGFRDPDKNSMVLREYM